MILLAAYEDFTRREGVCLREDNFETLLQLQEKKRKVARELMERKEEPMDVPERQDFDRRVTRLLELEKSYAEQLSQKLSSNRSELKQSRQNSVSANKLRRAYIGQGEASSKQSGLDGRA